MLFTLHAFSVNSTGHINYLIGFKSIISGRIWAQSGHKTFDFKIETKFSLLRACLGCSVGNITTATPLALSFRSPKHNL